MLGKYIQYFALLGLATLFAGSITRAVEASVVTGGEHDNVSASTGAQSFSFPTSSGFTVDQRLLGQDRVNVGGLAFNPALGSLIGSIANLVWTGDTFKGVYEVLGFGSELVFSDQVTVRATATLDGTAIGTPEIVSVTLSGTCGDSGTTPVLQDCRAKALLDAFTDSQSIALPAGTSFSSVDFVYAVLNSNESCQALDYANGVLTSTNLCLSGGVSIVDTSNLFDPGWSGKLNITYTYNAPEPASVGLLVFGVAGLLAVRRRRGLGA
jgi:hypothetical protein